MKSVSPRQLVQQAIALHGAGRLAEAEALYRRLLLASPKDPALLTGLGTLMLQAGNPGEAARWLERSVKASGGQPEAWFALGFGLTQLGNPEEALDCYDRAIELKPDNPDAHYNRANLLRELKRPDEALASYWRAIELKPDHAVACNNLALTLHDLKRTDEALASYDRAIELKPDYAVACNNRGLALQDLDRLDEALASYDRAIMLKPGYPNAHYNRGNALRDLKRLDEALASYDRAIELKPDFPSAHYNRGNVLQDLKRFDEALAGYDRVIALKPDHPHLFGFRLHAKMHLCDWAGLEDQFAAFAEKIWHGEASTPFAAIAISDSPALQKKAAQAWIREEYPEIAPPLPRHPRHEKIRIGYYSADYHNHATAHLMAELFERHDRNKFELIAFSFGPQAGDDMRTRLCRAFDRFIDVRAQSDGEIARLSRELEIDIAVDLKGYTQDSRTGIFAARAAPIQVGYLGYPGTMGAEFIDYLIADATLIPEDSRVHYSEKIVYLPNSYQVNDTLRPVSGKDFDRRQSGLPQEGFVFCCFNNNYKIVPASFEGWMRILERVGGSVLWLYESNSGASANLRKEAARRGVEPDRLVFARHLPLPEHLARYRLADLFLDTFPCNAHTTASDALWAGLPVLTRLGETFAGRVAASLLKAVGLPELIAASREEYEAMAVDLAARPEFLAQIRRKLETNKPEAPLFDTCLIARHIEAAFIEMYERHQADLPADHIHVPA